MYQTSRTFLLRYLNRISIYFSVYRDIPCLQMTFKILPSTCQNWSFPFIKSPLKACLPLKRFTIVPKSTRPKKGFSELFSVCDNPKLQRRVFFRGIGFCMPRGQLKMEGGGLWKGDAQLLMKNEKCSPGSLSECKKGILEGYGDDVERRGEEEQTRSLCKKCFWTFPLLACHQNCTERNKASRSMGYRGFFVYSPRERMVSLSSPFSRHFSLKIIFSLISRGISSFEFYRQLQNIGMDLHKMMKKGFSG